jgi:elongation factor Ts
MVLVCSSLTSAGSHDALQALREGAAEIIAKEREIALGQAMADPKNANKPANIIEKMIQGRIDKFYTDTVLIQQPFVKDQSVTITDLVNQLTAKTGEKVSIRRFTRYKMGEGIEKRVDDFAAEVAAMSK